MNAQQLKHIAAQLHDAEATRSPCAALREQYPDLDIQGAYAIQRINTERGLAQGRRLVGRKIGLTSRAVQIQLGVDQPDFGALFSDMGYSDSEELPWDKLLQPKVEAEIAFVLGTDLDHAQLSLPDLIAAIAYALPAIEVVGSRIANWNIKIVDTIADNASSGAFVLGTVPRQLTDFDPRLCGMVLERKGEPVSVGAGAACLGNPLNAALWLARKMVELGTPLRAGDLILSGALGPMVAVAPGDVVEARISGLGSVRAVFGPDLAKVAA